MKCACLQDVTKHCRGQTTCICFGIQRNLLIAEGLETCWMERAITFLNPSPALIPSPPGLIINGCSLYLYLALVLTSRCRCTIGIIRYLYIRVLCNKICWIAIHYVEEMHLDDFLWTFNKYLNWISLFKFYYYEVYIQTYKFKNKMP